MKQCWIGKIVARDEAASMYSEGSYLKSNSSWQEMESEIVEAVLNRCDEAMLNGEDSCSRRGGFYILNVADILK